MIRHRLAGDQAVVIADRIHLCQSQGREAALIQLSQIKFYQGNPCAAAVNVLVGKMPDGSC